MPSQPCGLHRRHSRIESVVPYTSAPANKGQVYFGRLILLEFETFRSVKAYLW